MSSPLPLAALAISALSLIGCTFHAHSAEQTVETSMSADGVAVIEVNTFNGSVTVESHDQPTIELRATMKAYGESPEMAQANCAALKCEPAKDGQRLVIQGSRPNKQSSASISVALKVPPYCELQLRTSNGTVKVNAVHAPVTIGTSNGTVECEQVEGAIDIDTSNGRIKVADATGPFRLHSSNGKVTYSGQPAGDDNSIETSNGSVSLTVPADLKIGLNAKTSNGSIRVHLSKSDIQEDSKKRFEGTVGNARASDPANVRIKTSNGSITVKEWDRAPVDSKTHIESRPDLPAEAEAQPKSESESESDDAA